jgi:hypothetical protein
LRQRGSQMFGERQAENDLAGIILNLNGIVPWIVASGCEHMPEVLGSPRHCSPGRLHIRVIEAEIVVTHPSIIAADMKVEARHGISQDGSLSD